MCHSFKFLTFQIQFKSQNLNSNLFKILNPKCETLNVNIN